MGRHRRAGAAPAAEQHAADAVEGPRGARRKKRAGIPVRAGLLGVSAAVAVGAVAVASGLLPGGGSYDVSGGRSSDSVHAGGAPDLLTQGDASAEPTARTSASASAEASRGADRSAAPSASASPTPKRTPAKKPSATASKQAAKTPERTKAAAPKPGKSVSSAPATKAPAAPRTASATPSAESSTSPSPSAASAQAAVLALVNQERAKVGCSPVTTSASLTALAQDFSEDMAARDFFSHTDPDGATPWDRAAAAGVEGLGGENIARGQADAQAVINAWMASEGHRANILNCDYRTLGVGVHLGSGGPWWTQDFGF
ncbi:CAP domain-containing protein [Streptomyces sp. NPDC001741]|uniref:CAP domain-containing protein n=1 Tax=Streptomyces sp. NPDC001741 TaxID=3364605 RepID=UPI0036B7C823